MKISNPHSLLPHVRSHLPYYAFTAVLLVGIAFARGGLIRNVWSLRYLEQVFSTNDEEPSRAGFDAVVDRFPHIRLWRAQEAYRNNNLLQADADTQRLLADDGIPTRFSREQILRLYGAILEAKGNQNEALSIWHEIEDINSLQGAAKKAAERGDLTSALRAYELAAELDPQNASRSLAHFLWQELEEPTEAEAILRQAISDYPYSGERQNWLHLLGQIYRAEERWDDAVAIYNYLLQIDPKDATAALRIADSQLARGDGVSTIMSQYQAAIALDPKRGDGYYSIGWLLSQSGEFSMADHWFEQATSLNPQVFWWQYAYASNALDLNDPEQAALRFERLLEQFPENHRAYAEAALAYHLSGRSQKAKEAIDKALRLAGPGAPSYYSERANLIYGL